MKALCASRRMQHLLQNDPGVFGGMLIDAARTAEKKFPEAFRFGTAQARLRKNCANKRDALRRPFDMR